METKDKAPEGTQEPVQRKAPPRKRPAEGTAPRKRPASAKRPAAAEEERPRKKRAAVPTEDRPRKKVPVSSKKAPVSSKKAEDQYQPYRKANNKKRAVRNRRIASQVTKFFSYENPVLKLFSKQDPDVFGDAGGRMEKKAAEAARRKKRLAELNAPAIVYTQPRAFNSSRLAVQLLTILAVVLALVLGMSVFFRVKTITVSGAQVYSPWTILETSGIKEGDNLLTFGRTKASGQIIANLPYVKSARIGIKLPDTVNIEIEEASVVYAIQDEDSVWWLINSNGRIVEQTNTANARNYTKVQGVTLTAPQPGAQSIATEPLPTETNAEGEYLPVAVTGASQLNAALHILQALENNDIVGSAASVDVTRLNDIILWYGTQYQVNLGGTDNMDYKIACMNDAILQMSGYQTGILDISFTTMTDKVIFTPFG